MSIKIRTAPYQGLVQPTSTHMPANFPVRTPQVSASHLAQNRGGFTPRTAPYQGALYPTSTHRPLKLRLLSDDPFWKAPHASLVQLVMPPTAKIAPDLHVLIASVPWRRASLNRLLRDVAAQTLLPSVVHLVLDGKGECGPYDVSLLKQRGVTIDVRENNPARGAGARWDVIDKIPADHVLCNFDDDVGLLTNDYLSWHHLSLKTSLAVCSGGYTPDGRFIMCNRLGIDYDGPINCLQAGAFSARVGVLRGLHTMPMAAEMLGMMGDDEGLIAAHFWRAGVVVRRVNTPVAFDPSGSDPRSQFLNMPGRITRFRNRLRELTGWPWGNV